MLEIKLGRKYKHSRTKEVYELVKIDKTPHFEEVEEDKKVVVNELRSV